MTKCRHSGKRSAFVRNLCTASIDSRMRGNDGIMMEITSLATGMMKIERGNHDEHKEKNGEITLVVKTILPAIDQKVFTFSTSHHANAESLGDGKAHLGNTGT